MMKLSMAFTGGVYELESEHPPLTQRTRAHSFSFMVGTRQKIFIINQPKPEVLEFAKQKQGKEIIERVGHQN